MICGPVSLLRAATSWPRNDCAFSASDFKAAWLASRREATSHVGIGDRLQAGVLLAQRDGLTGLEAEAQARRPPSRPVATSFCASASFACSFISEDRRAPDTALVAMNVLVMALSRRLQQRAEHVVDGGDEARRGLIGALELEQQRHLLVEVDAGDLGERVGGPLQQRRL